MTCLERTVSVRRGEWNQKHFYIFLIFLFGNSESDAFLPPVFPHKSKASTSSFPNGQVLFPFLSRRTQLVALPAEKTLRSLFIPIVSVSTKFLESKPWHRFRHCFTTSRKIFIPPLPLFRQKYQKTPRYLENNFTRASKLLGNRVGKNFSNAYITFNPNPARRNFHVATFLPSRITA